MNSNTNNKEPLQDEAEAAQSLGVLIQAHYDLLDLSCPGEKLVNLLLRRVERQVAHIHGRRRLQRVHVLLLGTQKPPVPVHR